MWHTLTDIHKDTLLQRFLPFIFHTSYLICSIYPRSSVEHITSTPVSFPPSLSLTWSPPVCIQCSLVDWNHLALNIAKIRKKPTFTDWQTKSWRKDILAGEGNPSPSGWTVKVFRWKLNVRKWIHDGCWDKALDIISTWIKMASVFSSTSCHINSRSFLLPFASAMLPFLILTMSNTHTVESQLLEPCLVQEALSEDLLSALINGFK